MKLARWCPVRVSDFTEGKWAALLSHLTRAALLIFRVNNEIGFPRYLGPPNVSLKLKRPFKKRCHCSLINRSTLQTPIPSLRMPVLTDMNSLREGSSGTCGECLPLNPLPVTNQKTMPSFFSLLGLASTNFRKN